MRVAIGRESAVEKRPSGWCCCRRATIREAAETEWPSADV